MKLVKGMLAASIMAAALAAGCSESPTASDKKLAPGIDLTAASSMQTGESRRVVASTQNLVGAKEIRWSVTPTGAAKVSPEMQNNGQSALFRADQPGVYVITATADAGNGQMVSNSTTITVNGPPMTSERQPEPAPQPPR